MYPTLTSGIWTLEVRVDGQPGGSHAFELAIPAGEPSRLSTEQVYQATLPSLVWIHKIDAGGRRFDTGSGFVIGKNRIATAFQMIDGSAGLEVEFAGGRTVKTDRIWDSNRLEDWAVVEADTLEVPALAKDDLKATYIGERLTVFNVEAGHIRAIGGVDVTGRHREGLFGERIQISPFTSDESVGGPLLAPSGKVTGILGGSMLPGARIPPEGLSISHSVRTIRNQLSVTPLALLPDTSPAMSKPLADLAMAGILCAPITPFASFLYGGTTIKLPSNPSAPAPRDVSDFSKKDPALSVYTYWQKKDKNAKGTIAAKVYDINNHLVIAVPARKATLYQEAPSRSAFSFEPGKLTPGIYRVDVLWQDQPVWRTFFRITD